MLFSGEKQAWDLGLLFNLDQGLGNEPLLPLLFSPLLLPLQLLDIGKLDLLLKDTQLALIWVALLAMHLHPEQE